MSGIFWIITSVILGAIGQIFLKIGMSRIGTIDAKLSLLDSIIYYVKVIFSLFVFLGLFSYGVSMFMWLWVLSKYELSYARPFVSLGYIIIAFYSFFFMGEHLGAIRWIGIILIVIGVVFISKS